MRTLLLTLLLLIALPVHAQEQPYRMRVTDVGNETQRVSVYLAPTSQAVNTVEGTLSFSSEVTPKNISTGNSVVLYFIEPPEVKDGRIHFAGIIPNGFTNTLYAKDGAGFLFSVDVSRAKGTATLKDAMVLRNDGEGTELRAPTLSVSLGNVSETEEDIPDTILPRWVSAERTRADSVSKEPLLILSAIDKESGISHFEVKEGNGPWQKTQTPYLIKDTSPFLHIYVRAVDNAGNVKETFVMSEVETVVVKALPYVLALILLGACAVYLLRRFKKRRAP